MKKSITKKIFIKICKLLGFEIIDQNEFFSPTLNKSLKGDLSNDEKSIILPLGEVKLTRKIKSLLILFRTNTEIEIWDQNKRRIFEFPKIEYVLRSLYSLIKSIKYLKDKNKQIDIKVKIIDDNSNDENLSKINNLIKNSPINIEIINHKKEDHTNIIKKQNLTNNELSKKCENVKTRKFETKNTKM